MADHPKHPVPEGISNESILHTSDIPGEQPQSSTTAPLTELCHDYHFFTPFLLFEFGELRHDVISEYCLKHDQNCKPTLRLFQKPIFDGFGSKDVNGVSTVSLGHMLYQVPKEYWQSLYDFIVAMGVIDRERHLFYHVAAQEVAIADPVFVEQSTVLPITGCPTVIVTAFGIDGNHAQIGFQPAKNLPIDRPKVIYSPPRPKLAQLAAALFNYAEKPYSGIEPVEKWTPI